MSEEECDYMSETFVSVNETSDVRPGLIKDRALLRQHNILKKKEYSDRENKEKHKPLKVLARENLESGLETPLDSDNKGFAMLAKMGFKPGSGLGKEGTGRSEPVKVEIKTNREGLGVKAALKEMRAKVEKKWKESLASATSVEDFRSRVISEANERQAGIDLFKSQKTCYSLDHKQGLAEPVEPWFWPEKMFGEGNKEEESEEEDEKETDVVEIPVEDKLEMLTYYLRNTYFYCVWCGTTFDDEKDLREECPGPTRSDH